MAIMKSIQSVSVFWISNSSVFKIRFALKYLFCTFKDSSNDIILHNCIQIKIRSWTLSTDWCQWCWWHCDLCDLTLVTSFECLWPNFDVGNICWMLVSEAYIKELWMLVTKMVETVHLWVVSNTFCFHHRTAWLYFERIKIQEKFKS